MLFYLGDKYENWWNVSISNGWFDKKKLRTRFRTTKYKLLTNIELGIGKPTIKNIKNVLCVYDATFVYVVVEVRGFESFRDWLTGGFELRNVM